MELLCPTAIFKKFEFLRQFSKKQSMIKKNYLLRWTEKFVDKARQCFAFLHIKPIIIYSRVKLIPWNVVNLSHLYLLIYIFACVRGSLQQPSKSRIFYCTLLSPVHIYFCYFRWPFFCVHSLPYIMYCKKERKNLILKVLNAMKGW